MESRSQLHLRLGLLHNLKRRGYATAIALLQRSPVIPCLSPTTVLVARVAALFFVTSRLRRIGRTPPVVSAQWFIGTSRKDPSGGETTPWAAVRLPRPSPIRCSGPSTALNGPITGVMPHRVGAAQLGPKSHPLQHNTSYPPKCGEAPLRGILPRYSLASMLACILRRSCYPLVVGQARFCLRVSVSGPAGDGS